MSLADMCANVGGSCGASEPKTFRKWVWPFIKAVAHHFVFDALHFCVNDSHLFALFQILFNNRFKNDNGRNCLQSIDGADFQICPTSSREVV